MAQPMSATAKPAGPSEPPLTPLSGMPKRVGRQIVMLIMAYAATLGLQITIDLALISETNSVTFILPTVIFAVSLGAWGVVRVLAPYADPLLVPIAAFITGIGIVFIRRLDRSATTADPLPADAGVFAGQGGRQLMYFIAGVVLLGILLAVVRNHRVLRGYSYILLFTGIFIAALPGFLPYSISGSDGSKNWIRLGGFSIQPSEFAKIMLLIFFAVYLVRKRDMLTVAGPKFLGMQFPRLKDLGPILIVWAASIGLLVLEKDLGTSLLLFGMFLAMLYMATRRASWILIGLSLFIGACVAIYPFFAHLQTRVQIWLDPWNETYIWETGSSWQLVQGLTAMNSGGLLGDGPGTGNPNLIPASESDFILAAFGEEAGLVGLLALLLMYAFLVERGFKTGVMCRDLFGKLMAGGIAFLVALQLFVVLGGVTGLIPMTGLTTIFMAAGGSSLVASWLMLGLLIRISDDARKPWQVSYGLQKTEAPPEFLAEQAARRAAEQAEREAAAGVAADGPLPGGDQPTELIIPASMQGGGEPSAPTSGPPQPTSAPPNQQGPQPGPPSTGRPPQSPPPAGPAGQSPPGRTTQQPGGPGPGPTPPPSAFEYKPQPPSWGTDKKEGQQ